MLLIQLDSEYQDFRRFILQRFDALFLGQVSTRPILERNAMHLTSIFIV